MIFDVQQTGLNNLSLLGIIFGALLNAGALTWWVRSGTDMKMAQKDASEAKKKAEEAATSTRVLESRVNQQDTIISEIRNRMAKLDRVDEMVAAVRMIEEAVSKGLVPRTEHEKVWKADDDRFERQAEAQLRADERMDRVEDDIKIIRQHLAAQAGKA